VQRVTSTQKLPMVRIDEREKRGSGPRERDAGRRRQEVLVRQPQHLHEIGQRAFAAIVLPVGVGDEAIAVLKERSCATRTVPPDLNGNTACRRITA